jgi:CHAT domain-containing protein/tetratricopeptide (TPR) repeat protein
MIKIRELPVWKKFRKRVQPKSFLSPVAVISFLSLASPLLLVPSFLGISASFAQTPVQQEEPEGWVIEYAEPENLERLPQEREAKSYVGTMNRALQAYYLENGTFPDSLESLIKYAGFEFHSDTENYTYQFVPQPDKSRSAIIVAQSKQSGLRSYIGAVILIKKGNEFYTDAHICETDSSSGRPLAMPELTGDNSNPIICPAVQTVGTKAEAERWIKQGGTELGDIFVPFSLVFGKPDPDLQPLKKALSIYREIGEHQGEGQVLKFMGQTYLAHKQYREAIEYLQQSLTVTQQIQDRQQQAVVLNNIGLAYLALENPTKALESSQQSLSIAQDTKNLWQQAQALNVLGNIYWFQGKYDKANESFEQGLAIARSMSSESEKVPTSLEDRQRLQALERIFLDSLGLRLFKAGKLAEAEKMLFAAVQVLEKTRKEFLQQRAVLASGNESVDRAIGSVFDPISVSVNDNTAGSYNLLQQVLIAQNKVDSALEIAELGRTRVLVELLARRASPQATAQLLINSPTIQQIQQTAVQQKATLVAYSIIDEPASVQEMLLNQKKQPQASQLFIWVVQPTGKVAFRKVDLNPLWKQQNTSLADLVTSSRESIGIRGIGAVSRPGVEQNQETEQTQRLQQLHKLLIEPIAKLLPTDPNERVIFIPHKELFLVPFPALKDDGGKYLIEKHTILTAPSIQVLNSTYQQRQRTKGKAKDLLVVGNPTMPEITLEAEQPPQQLPSLPSAEQEAIEVGNLLHVQPLIGNKATKETVLGRISQSRIIHLATHGLIDFNPPSLENVEAALSSSISPAGTIALAPSGTDNGLLSAEEILDLKLNAELVVLSACNTGRGEITGDGVIGLSRSLIIAGVPSMIVSLWSVPDAPTASLMSEFYRNIQERQLDKAQALRQAMLTTMRQHPNPINWAAFTLIGQAE